MGGASKREKGGRLSRVWFRLSLVVVVGGGKPETRRERESESKE